VVTCISRREEYLYIFLVPCETRVHRKTGKKKKKKKNLKAPQSLKWLRHCSFALNCFHQSPAKSPENLVCFELVSLFPHTQNLGSAPTSIYEEAKDDK
jgi:hypothetical protein